MIALSRQAPQQAVSQPWNVRLRVTPMYHRIVLDVVFLVESDSAVVQPRLLPLLYHDPVVLYVLSSNLEVFEVLAHHGYL